MRLINVVVKAAASVITAVGCSGPANPHEGRFKEPVPYETLRASQLPVFEKGRLPGEELLASAHERGRMLVDIGGDFKGIVANTNFIFDSIGKGLDGPIWVGAQRAMFNAEEKGILDSMLEKELITAERHKFISDRLASYLWNNPIGHQYLLSLSKEKELIWELAYDGIIDEDTKEYFNSEEWFKQFEWIRHVESMFKVLTYGVKNEKLDSELVKMLVKSKNYELANRIAQLYIAGELSREETTGLIEKLNIKFANAILDFPWECKSFAEYKFDAKETLPLLLHHHTAERKTDLAKLAAAWARNNKLLKEGHILGGWMDDIKDSFSDLGIDYYNVLGLNKKDSPS